MLFLRIAFTIWAYLTFFLLMLIAFVYHIVVAIITLGRGVDLMYKCYRPWAVTWAFLNGVRLDIRGEEHIEKNRSYVFVMNHGSTADIVIVAAAMKNRYRPLGKKELVRLPVMGFMFRKALILVDRSNPESRRQSMERMREIIGKNISVLIAPEGTRNRTPEPLQPFKDGAFRLAIECQLPVIPMVLLNTRRLYPNDEWLLHHCPLGCHFLEPVSTEGLKEKDIPELKEKVHTLMKEHIVKHDILYSG
ncbi:MAG: 1-acyl-sn-glycerol-3-phosphate acyltransferase [Chitinophagales bacterium]|nr:MAG: 1-acyl-sn-glycerol-3-phosphate acyltransferase [Chitinophagales bacterium]